MTTNLVAPWLTHASATLDWPSFDLLDVCAGAGGASLGARLAGFAPVGVELDADAVATHRAAVGACVLADVRAWQPPAALRPRVVAGGVPCQSWSSAGKRRGFADPRGELYRELIRLGVACGAEALVLENVRGLVHWRDPRDGRSAVEWIADDMRAAGFAHVAWRVLCAADHGVPQLRHRVAIVAFRDAATSARFAWPAATHADPKLGLSLPPWTTVRAALGLGDAPHAAVRGDRELGFQGVRCLDVDAPGFTVGTARNADLLARLDRPATALSAAEHRSALAFGARGAASRPRRAGDTLNPALSLVAALRRSGLADRPATTIQGDPHVAPAGALRAHAHTRDARGVRLTLAQCALLQDFPPGMRFAGNVTSQHRQVGNAWPRRMAAAVFSAVRAALDGAPR